MEKNFTRIDFAGDIKDKNGTPFKKFKITFEVNLSETLARVLISFKWHILALATALLICTAILDKMMEILKEHFYSSSLEIINMAASMVPFFTLSYKENSLQPF